MSKILNEIAKFFGSTEQVFLLSGGEGQTYKSGKIILKKTNNEIESIGLADFVYNLEIKPGLRIQKPVKSVKGNWVESGYVAWEFLEGKEFSGNFEQKITICKMFNKTFEGYAKPKFLEYKNDPWFIADKYVWGEKDGEYQEDFQEIIRSTLQKINPINLESQLIHGDISGNIISDDVLGAAVIDLTFYYRPVNYSIAILLVDMLTWEGADISLYGLVKEIPSIDQLLLRAGLKRAVEQFEQCEAGLKSKQEAIIRAKKNIKTLERLRLI